jgi:hypothetical protein
MFRYRSAEHFVDVFRRFYGPTHKAFAALDATGQAELAAAIEDLVDQFGRTSPSKAVTVPGEYLEVVVSR